jgi:hypothetical protein
MTHSNNNNKFWEDQPSSSIKLLLIIQTFKERQSCATQLLYTKYNASLNTAHLRAGRDEFAAVVVD